MAERFEARLCRKKCGKRSTSYFFMICQARAGVIALLKFISASMSMKLNSFIAGGNMKPSAGTCSYQSKIIGIKGYDRFLCFSRSNMSSLALMAGSFLSGHAQREQKSDEALVTLLHLGHFFLSKCFFFFTWNLMYRLSDMM